jgi:recombination associated protein RdgC
VAELEARLDAGRFIECSATQPSSVGWVEPRGQNHGACIESIGGQWIVKLCAETKGVPASVVKTRLEAALDKIKEQTGRRPKGKQAKEIKDEIVQDLMPRAFPKRSSTWVWIDPKKQWVVVGAGSLKKADDISSRVVELLGGGVVLSLVQTNISPAVAMAEWLQSKQAPAGFSIDRECELKQPDSEKSAVKYSRHSLEIDEVAEHIKQGKVPTQVAMSWGDRMSFVLTESMAIKKIKLLDVVLEGAKTQAESKDDSFDADVAIATGELSRFIPELIEALGGELQLG